jgi:NAD dependent epimerase/dehydratase family enzyme
LVAGSPEALLVVGPAQARSLIGGPNWTTPPTHATLVRGKRVIPAKVAAAGSQFRFPVPDEALRDVMIL